MSEQVSLYFKIGKLSGLVEGLTQRLQASEKRIAELEGKLEAFKQFHHDTSVSTQQQPTNDFLDPLMGGVPTPQNHMTHDSQPYERESSSPEQSEEEMNGFVFEGLSEFATPRMDALLEDNGLGDLTSNNRESGN